MNFRYCEYILQLIQTSDRNQSATEAYLRRSICGYDGVDLMVCCPSSAYIITTTQSSLFFFGFFGTTPPSYNVDPQQPPPPPPQQPPPQTSIDFGRISLPTFENNRCGMSNASHTRIVGGVNAQLGAWPWIAVLGYSSSTDNVPRFQCGGTLITQQHIITAGHCIKDNL